MKKEEIENTVKKNLQSAVEFLQELIAFPSTRGNEREISRFLKRKVEEFTDSAELIAIPESIVNDPDYSFKLDNFSYEGTANLRVKVRGKGEGKTLTLNAHLDVVPPSEGQDNAFSPRIEKNTVFGRGACDCKGQIATLWLVLKSLHDLKLKPGGDIFIDFVVEEECGGNGSLLVVREGLDADAAVVMEPTGLQVVHLVRGAVWFEVEARGRAGHSGSPESTSSALEEAIKVMKAIEGVREKLLAVSRKDVPQIALHPNPMPCTFGLLHAGNWPSATPSKAVLKGVFGFLPPFKRGEVQRELNKAVSQFQAEVRFNMLNNEPSFTDESHPLVQTMLEAAEEAGIESRPEFMNASCDAWRYSEQLHIPAIVFGAGSIATAHARDEQVSVEDMRRAALALVCFIRKWSGLHHAG